MSSFSNRIAAELRGDRVIWMIVVMLSLFSVLAVYSSASSMAFKERGGSTEWVLVRHVLTLSMGWVVLYLCYLMHYMRYKQFAPSLLLLSVGLLLLTFAFGVTINNATRWLRVPLIGLTFQTSDLAKIGIVTYVAKTISDKQDVIKDFQSAFLPILVPILVVCGLIAPANLSTALLIFAVCMAMMFIGRVDVKYILLLMFCGVLLFGFLIIIGRAFPSLHIRVDTWVSRLQGFFAGTGDRWQIEQAEIAIARGGWVGNLPGSSIQRNYLPEASSDYLFAIIMEEYGLIGGTLIMGLFVLLFLRVVRLVTIGQKSFGVMLAVGMALLVTMQALANMAVAVNFVPVTGLSMPMLSMGGTSLIFSCASFGIILSVSKYIEETKSS